MSNQAEALLVGLNRLGMTPDGNQVILEPGWYDVVTGALAEGGYYIAPLIPDRNIQSRLTDPRTSHAAEPSMKRAGTQRHRLLQAFGDAARRLNDGLTDEEAMEWAVDVSARSEYAKRCSELRALGLIVDTGKNRKGNSGLDRIVCRITEQGQAVLRRLDS